MDMASEVFGIRVAQHALVEPADGSPAHLTRRFDFREGVAFVIGGAGSLP